MMVRITRSGPFSWNRFATAWVTGGIPAGSPRVQPVAYTGYARGSARDEPTHKRGPHKWDPRFEYRLARPLRSLVHLTGSPQQGEPRTPWRPTTPARRYRWGRWLTYVGGWPHLGVTRTLFRRWWLPRARPPEEDTDEVTSKWVALYVRGRHRLQRWRWNYYRTVRAGIYRGRWWSGWSYGVAHDFVRNRWNWHQQRGPNLVFHRSAVVTPVGGATLLRRQLRDLWRRHRRVTRWQSRARRVSRYRRYVFERISKRNFRTYRRHWRYRRLRLREAGIRAVRAVCRWPSRPSPCLLVSP